MESRSRGWRAVVMAGIVAVLVAPPAQAHAQGVGYPTLARDEELRLAMSAGPLALSQHADVYLMGGHGFEKAISGTNGWACLVVRSATSRIQLAPHCLNPDAEKTVLPAMLLEGRLQARGMDGAAIDAELTRQFAEKTLPMPSGPAHAYMLSSGQRLGASGGNFKPHFMLYVPYVTNKSIGGDPSRQEFPFVGPFEKPPAGYRGDHHERVRGSSRREAAIAVSRDRLLIDRAVRGDADALETIAAAHRPAAFRIANAVIGDRDAAEDVAQDVFVRLASALPHLRADTELSSWVYRVTVNLCRDRLRWRRRRARDVSTDEALDAPQLASDERPDDALDLERARRALELAVERLPAEQREVLALRYLSELPYAEIARVTSVAPGTIASRVFRALERLGDELEPWHLEVLK